jgi:nicotinamide-nucleotide amidase
MTRKNDVEIILVGDELLKGERRDSHVQYLARGLLRRGVRVARTHVVGDAVDDIAAVVTERLPLARVLVLTGGLGPTPDDITRVGVAQALGLDLEFHEPSWETIERFFAQRGKTATDVNRQQAEFPAGSTVVPNALGTAPGFWVEHQETAVVALPGPPIEVQQMFEADVLSRIATLFQREPVRVETFRTIGVGESNMRSIVGEKLDAIGAFNVSSMPSRISVDIVLTEKPGLTDRHILDEEADRFERDLRASLGTYFYERGERSLFEVVHGLLVERGETLAIAESLTGGWIGKRFTDLSGSSAYLLADVVAYGNDAKVDYLGVQNDTLEHFGAVSEEACTEMVNGIRHRTGATYGMATTGIAGPTGGTPTKPVGLTYIGVSWDGGCQVKRQVYAGTRDDVRRRASHGVVWLLYDHLMTGR